MDIAEAYEVCFASVLSLMLRRGTKNSTPR